MIPFRVKYQVPDRRCIWRKTLYYHRGLVQCYEVMMTWCFVILVPPPCHSMVHTCKLSVEVTWPDTGLWLVNTDHMTWTKVSDRFIPFLDGATPGQWTRILRKLSSDDFISQGSDYCQKPDPHAVMCLHNGVIQTIIWIHYRLYYKMVMRLYELLIQHMQNYI